MQEFVDFLVKSIVRNKEAVEIDESSQEGIVNITVKVNPEDMGLIIGKGGKTIRSIRALARAKAIKDNVRVYLDIIEE